MSKKTFIAIEKVRNFIDELDNDLQIEYLTLTQELENSGYLIEPFAKKLDNELFEIRLRRGRQVRVIYFYHHSDIIFGVHAFTKKTQKTPLKEMKQAKKIVSKIKRGEYRE